MAKKRKLTEVEGHWFVECDNSHTLECPNCGRLIEHNKTINEVMQMPYRICPYCIVIINLNHKPCQN